MTRMKVLLSASAAALILLPAAAQAMTPEEAAEMEALRTRVETLEGLVNRLVEGQGAVAAQAEQASVTAIAAQTAATEASAAVAAQPSVSFGAAPRVRTASGWDFRPFGRLQYDVASVNAPGAINDPGLGFSNELRRGRIGVRGAIPGGFGYKVEIDFADNNVEFTDALLSYETGDVEFTVGQHNPFQSLEELTSSRFTSFMERAAFTDAFGFERRVGASVGYSHGDFAWNGGVFTSNIDDLTSDEANAWSFDTRATFSPEMGRTRLHLGGSLHYRDLGSNPGARYRQRPGVHSTDTRFIATPNLPVTQETSYGVEAAVIHGPFHAVAEGHWLRASLAGMPDPTYFGGYAEAGIFLTPGDSRGYDGGKFERTRPAHPVGEGGIGAIQLNARYDYLDLTDNGVTGGTQNLLGLAMIWTPIDHARFSINYDHIEYDDAVIPAGLATSYSVDVFGARAEVDF